MCCLLFVIRYCLLFVVGCFSDGRVLFAVCCWLLVVGRLLFVVRCCVFVVCCL